MPVRRDLVAAQARDGGADDPGEGEVAAVALAPAIRPCLLACVPSWMFTGALEDAVPGLGAVARGVDAVVARAALMVVDAHGAARPELDPGVLGQPDSGPDARRHHDVVGVDRLAPGPDRTRRPERVEQDLLDLRPDQDAHAEALGRVLHVGGHVGVERAHDLRRASISVVACCAGRVPRPSRGRCSRRR